MIPYLPWYKHLYYSIRYGEWDVGWVTRKELPGKPYLWLGTTYYDGRHWVLHVGPFYLGAGYY